MSGTSKLPYATKVVDWVKHDDGYSFNLNTEDLHLPVIVKAVPIPELQIHGIGVFFHFPDDGLQQIGWIPNKNKEEVEQVLDIKEFNCFISSVKVKELSSNFSKVSIVLQMYVD